MTTWRALVFCIIIFIPRGSLIKKRQAPGARKAQLGQEGRAWVDLRWEKWTACSTVVSAPKYCHEWKKKRLKIITTTHIRRKIASESWSRSDCPWSQQALSSLLDFRWTKHFTADSLTYFMKAAKRNYPSDTSMNTINTPLRSRHDKFKQRQPVCLAPG